MDEREHEGTPEVLRRSARSRSFAINGQLRDHGHVDVECRLADPSETRDRAGLAGQRRGGTARPANSSTAPRGRFGIRDPPV